jgi:hypothetical protein
MSRLPNFFLVGAPKAGTTSLYHYLDQHPDIYMSAIKEPCFFSNEFRLENFDPFLRRKFSRDAASTRKFLAGPMREKRFSGIITRWEDYLRLFANARNEPALGEASVGYLWSLAAPEQIATRIPTARILIMLRDPSERAFSQYLHGLGAGSIRWTFREHIQRNLRDTSRQFSIHHPFLEFGLYSEQLTRYRKRFGPNVWVGLYEDFTLRPREIFRDICLFLGIDPGFSPDMSCRHLESHVPSLAAVRRLKSWGLWNAAAKVMPAPFRPSIRRALTSSPGAIRLETADRGYLIDFYRHDIISLSTLLDHDLSQWLRLPQSSHQSPK